MQVYSDVWNVVLFLKLNNVVNFGQTALSFHRWWITTLCCTTARCFTPPPVNPCSLALQLPPLLDVCSAAADLQKGGSLSATRAGQEDCREIWEKLEESPIAMRSLQSSTVRVDMYEKLRTKCQISLGKPAYLLCRYPFSVDQLVPECDWEVFLRETASMIVEQQSPQRHVHSCKCTICIPIHRVIVMDKVLWHSSHLFDSADY